ncbi:hypothetical protein V2J09_014854 [Rumex salicifolius]
MEEDQLDLVLVPAGLVVFGIYHGWLLVTVKRRPRRTVIGLNAESPTTAITLSSLISVFVSSSSSSTKTASNLIYGNKSAMISSIKYFSILPCFLVAFLLNVQCIRYYAHISFLATLPTSQGRRESMEYVAYCLNRGSLFWSLGLRAFYLSFPLFLWIFGPIPMFVCCCFMSFVLYFLDTTTSFTRQLHCQSFTDKKVVDHLLIGAGLGVLLAYHGWLIYLIIYNPRRTVIGLNADSRRLWVHSLMDDPLKNGVLAIQTLRNNMMASTQQATIAITLSSLIVALVGSESADSSSSDGASLKTSHFLGVKVTYNSFAKISSEYLSVLLCFLLAFFCNMQAIRHYAHVSFLITSPSSQGNTENIEYVARHLNQGSLFWSLGMRAFYLSFPLLLWIFGSIPMFVCCVVLTFVLYFLDTTSHYTKDSNCPLKENNTSNSLRSNGSESTMLEIGIP